MAERGCQADIDGGRVRPAKANKGQVHQPTKEGVMEKEIADMIAGYAIAYTQAGEEGRYWCKTIMGDLVGILCGDYISMVEIEEEE